MVKEIQKENNKLYRCEECGLHYETRKLAKECENWCRENKSCNLEIVKHAVESRKVDNSST